MLRGDKVIFACAVFIYMPYCLEKTKEKTSLRISPKKEIVDGYEGDAKGDIMSKNQDH